MRKTLFLNPPSFEGFDGGAGARYQARREIRSFWFPTWLAHPAAMPLSLHWRPTVGFVPVPADSPAVQLRVGGLPDSSRTVLGCQRSSQNRVIYADLTLYESVLGNRIVNF